MSKFRQAMPPEGGYPTFQFLRTKSLPKYPGMALFTAAAASTIIFGAHYILERRNYLNEMVENEESEIALEPFLQAEKERAMLKQLWLNREEENELMKNVPGWVTGTWYGEKVFKNPTNRWMPLSTIDVYTHNHKDDAANRECYAVAYL